MTSTAQNGKEIHICMKLSQMRFTVSGNAYSPMDLTESGMATEVRGHIQSGITTALGCKVGSLSKQPKVKK